MTAFVPQHDPLGQLPKAASDFASDVDGLYYFCAYVSIFFFFLIAGLLVYTTIKHRRRSADQAPASTVTHNTALEVVWTLIPTVILMVIFAWGWRGNLAQTVAPGESLQYRVEAQKWFWSFYHPGEATAAAELWVPVDTPVRFTMSSSDVLHSMYIPAFRAKRDVVPGRYQTMWFRATEEGDFPLFCTEYCGTGHSTMTSVVHVVPMAVYETKPWKTRPDDPVEWGRELYTSKCAICHSTDGTPRVGPTFKGLWGREEQLADGTTVVVDAAYFEESVRMPQAKIVAGYENQIMTQFPESQIDADGLDALQQFIKTLTD